MRARRRTLTIRTARPTTSSKEIKLEGKLVQFVYRNPHSFVHVEAPDDKGVQQRWAVEWSGTGQLGAPGREARVAEGRRRVVINARPSRVPGEYRALMVKPEAPERRLHLGQPRGSRRSTKGALRFLLSD